MADAFQDRGLASEIAASGDRAGSGTVVVCQVLAGMGGIGKTQLAAHRAHQVLRDKSVDLVVWVTATSRQAILQTYAQAGIAVAGADPADVQAAAQVFLTWLSSSGRSWLVVLDDLQELSDLRELWPPERSSCQVIVTTRRRDPALRTGSRRLVEVGLFSPEQSLAYLSERLAVHGLGECESAQEIADLAADLGHLPLALAQAASYIIDTAGAGMGVHDYRALLRERRPLAELAPGPDALPDDQEATLAAVLALSLERADRHTEGLATPLLQLAGFLDPNGIPVLVLAGGPVRVHLVLARSGFVGRRSLVARMADRGLRRGSFRLLAKTALVNRLSRWDNTRDAESVLAVLHRLSLADLLPPDAEHSFGVVRVHALTQRAARDTIGAGQTRPALTVADALLDSWPEIEHDTALAQALRSNTDHLTASAGEALWLGKKNGAHSVLFRVGRSLRESGQLAAAAAHFQRLHIEAHNRLGPDHPDTLITRHDLASCRGEAGDPAAAADMSEALFADRLRVLGPDHPSTLATRHALARWRGEAGDPAGAATAYEALLADRLRVLGPDHPDTLATRHNLTYWRSQASDQVGAAELLEAVLADHLRVLGPDHPGTLTTRYNLAHRRGEAGDPAGAATAYEALLADRLRVLGPDHPDTLATRNELAQWRGEAGDLSGATELLEALLADQLRVLGPDHPDTLTTRHKLARLRGEAGDPFGATELLEALLADRLRVLGPDHPDTLTTRHNLAHRRGEAGDPAGAATAYEALLADRLRVLGPDHPNTLNSRHNLAYRRGEAGDPAGAVELLEALLADQLRVLGPDHPNTLNSRHNLAQWRGEAGDPAGAATAYEALLADRLRVLGPDHPDTLATRHELAQWRGEAGDPAGAAKLLEALLADQLRVLGPDHPNTLTTRHNLAGWRGEAGDPAGAAELLEAVLADQLRVLGPDHPNTLTTRHQLAGWRRRAQ
ncbi:tetratricopeptide repeat protein [Kitasatospora sp. NPDC048365]|uniref:tetratricopeptide repeat protein n=1 Tax=Kitasatospora sp. NPDC048365 TaxID=3364050 RepID=UPI00371C3B53